ncbi:hypothetical protein [Lichenicola sp.]|uniref:hypothetical protein n=1 Tax=Lichenicola sp. TaxID=2804529 RepID=UPI003B00F43E
MSARFRAAASALVLALSRLPACAQPSQGLSTPTLDAIESAAHDAEETHCTTAHCSTIRIIDQSLHILLESQATTNGLTRKTPSNRDDLSRKRLDGALLDHPALFQDVCTEAQAIAGEYGKADIKGDLFVAVGLIDIASRMDARDHGQCLPAILAAMPRTTAADTAISNARTLCENRQPAEADCKAISR